MDIQPGTSAPAPQPPAADPDRPSVITNRSDLIQALCDAAQLEHGLCCAYLFAALSIKRHPEEGVPPVRMADLRNWESVLLLIARQEMEHLGIVGNLLTAVGGMPYLQSPAFPIATDRYGDLPGLPLKPFSKDTVQLLLEFETPEWIRSGAIILRRIAGLTDFQEIFSIVCQQICGEMEWAACDFWVPEGGTFVPLYSVSGGLKISYGPEVGKDMWARWQTPHPPGGELLQTKQTLNSSIVNTYAEIPTYQGDELKAVWRFFYETFRTVDEDDSLVQALEILLSESNVISLRNPSPTPAAAPVEIFSRLRVFQPKYSTIGGFYRRIRKGFLRLCFQDHKPTGQGLFTGFQTGNLDIGIADRNLHDMDLATVSGLNSALDAINQIIETGEACSNKRVASHYLRLCTLLTELDAVMAQPGKFEPARAIVSNPITAARRGSQAPPGCTLLDHPDAAAVAEIFDASYEIMLQMVARYLAFPDDKVLQGMAFGPLMTMAIRPLAEILGELNADHHSDQKAGPPFQSAARDILHPHRLAAWTAFAERLEQIALTCLEVQKNLQPEHKNVGQRLAFISENVKYIAFRLETAVAQAKAGKSLSGAEN